MPPTKIYSPSLENTTDVFGHPVLNDLAASLDLESQIFTVESSDELIILLWLLFNLLRLVILLVCPLKYFEY